MIGATLQELLEQLRAEIGASPNPAQSANAVPYWQQVLTRTQRRLYAKRKWSHLWVYREKPILAGDRYYSFPADLDYSQITQAWVKYSVHWEPIGYGITPVNYNASDSDIGTANEPVRFWNHYENDQFEVWPLPSASLTQTLRFYGYKKLTNLVQLTDKADLDNDLIVLFAAAEILERMESEDAKSKAALAQDHYLSLTKNDTKDDPFILGGQCPPANQQVVSALRDYPLYGGKI